MKKIISLSLALVLILGLTACGTEEKPVDPGTSQAKTEEANKDQEVMR